MTRQRDRRGGFALVEVMIALVTIALIALFTKLLPEPAYIVRINVDEKKGRKKSAEAVIAGSKVLISRTTSPQKNRSPARRPDGSGVLQERLGMIASRPLLLAAMILSTIGQLAAQEAFRSPNPLATLDEATLKAFVEKPLFEQSRKPPLVAPPRIFVATPVPTIIEQPPSLRLLGVIEGTRSIFAVVYRNDKGKTEPLHPGDRIGSWVVQITAGNLRVISGDQTFEYRLFGGSSSQAPVAVQMLPPALVIPAVAAPAAPVR